MSSAPKEMAYTPARFRSTDLTLALIGARPYLTRRVGRRHDKDVSINSSMSAHAYHVTHIPNSNFVPSVFSGLL